MRTPPESSGIFERPAAARARSRMIDLDGPVHYVDYGGDGPPLLMVHGLGGSHLNWAAVAPAFARRRRVIALDLAGHGRTPLGKRRATLEANTELIARFHTAMFDEPATLMGNSMGGLLAKMVAAEHRRHVRALVLVNAPLPLVRGAVLDPQVAIAFAVLALPGVGSRLVRLREALLSSEALVRSGMRLCCADPKKLDRALIAAHIALVDEMRAMPWRHDALASAARSTVRAVLTPRFIARIAQRVQAPTLVIHGDRDRLVPLAVAKAAAARRGWDLAVFENIGHVPQLECPARFVETVERWLDRSFAAPERAPLRRAS